MAGVRAQVNILGVAFLSDASAAVVRGGKLISAVSEERLNRVKLWNGIPRRAIATALDLAGLTLDEIDLVATHGAAPREPDVLPFQEKERAILRADLPEERREAQLASLRSRYSHEKDVLAVRTPGYLEEIAGLGHPMRVFAHHEAHAACAYYGSSWEECFVLTADGWGEDASSTAWIGRAERLTPVARSYTIDSLGYFYGSITKALGFVPHRHEGKVLGLAAHCMEPRSYGLVRNLVDYDRSARRFIGRMDGGLYVPRFDNPALEERLRQYPREDVAASAQRTLEEVVCACVSDLATDSDRVALAGGIFANVRLNQRIRELPGVRDVFVFPNMGDGGLSVGAAWLAGLVEGGQRPEPLRTVYLGPEQDESQMAQVLAASGLRHQHCTDIHDRVAGLLADGQVVARFVGRMEYGPRALGHRSILAPATDPSINSWLNDRLGRTEFMPFAPATLEEAGDQCYVGLPAGRDAASFMTMTFTVTTAMREEAPAVVHVDGTARPQLVSEVDTPDLYRILKAYQRRTGKASVINTSFNMHEEPIVCTLDDALRSCQASQLPWLAAGPFLVESEHDVLE